LERNPLNQESTISRKRKASQELANLDETELSLLGAKLHSNAITVGGSAERRIMTTVKSEEAPKRIELHSFGSSIEAHAPDHGVKVGLINLPSLMESRDASAEVLWPQDREERIKIILEHKRRGYYGSDTSETSNSASSFVIIEICALFECPGS
jgi:hypothetical protein